jgi:membrane protease YdiL (CAAX protease family)
MATKLIYKMLVTLLSWIVLHARSANTKEIESPIPAVGALLFGVTVLGLGSVACWSRLAIGSIWPSVLMHATWNSMIQDGFDALTAGEGPRSVEGGESGILVAGVSGVFALAVRAAMRRSSAASAAYAP